VAGDQLSLAAWTQLAALYEVKNDTTHTVDALKQMLVVAPTNQPLRELAFKLFIKYEHPEAAEQAALDGLKLDPTNADLWDLLSNARVYKGDYKGAVDALEQVAINDSTKADSSFLLKITVMAGQQPDTVRLLKWAKVGAAKYPANVGLMGQLLTAYTLAGPLDSAAAVGKRLIAVDSTQVTAALGLAQQLITAKRAKEAVPFLEYAYIKGDATAKENAAALYLNGALPLIQAEPDTAIVMLRSAINIANANGKVAPIANFYLGLLLLQQVPKLDPETEKQKSCDLANKEQALLIEAEKGLKTGQSYKPDDAAKYLKYVDGYKPRVASMLKAYCKP
jgi:tetratricopeptide (TPR) repeat protein